VRIASDWPLADNHIYLLGYWLLAAGLAPVPTRRRPRPHRLEPLVNGLAFACAVLWKSVLSLDYMEGVLPGDVATDPRFTDRPPGRWLTTEQLDANREALGAWPEGAEPLEAPRCLNRRASDGLPPHIWSVVIVEAPWRC
jgi:hypothetical protein